MPKSTKYILISDTIEADEFYEHIGGLEEITIKQKDELFEKPAALVEFAGSLKALYEYIGCSENQVRIFAERKYSIPRPNRPTVKKIHYD